MSQAHITSDPRIMMGKPVFAGTRIPVDLILEKLAAGETAEQVIVDYPALSRGSIQTALASAANASRTLS